MDLKDFKNAIIYYKKELEHYVDNPAEVNLFILAILSGLNLILIVSGMQNNSKYC